MNRSVRTQSEIQSVRILLACASILGLVFLFSAAGCRNAGTPGTPIPNEPTVRSPYEIEKRLLPPEVHELFYAVKDSLDYAVVTGDMTGPFEEMPEDPSPQESLTDYDRVTPQLLNRFGQTFVVELYAVDGWNYELIVLRRSRPDEKYRATRERMFRWVESRWEPIGPYLHY